MLEKPWRGPRYLRSQPINPSTVAVEHWLAQYMGEVSLPLYLVHIPVFFILKRPVRNVIWLVATQKPLSDTFEASVA